MKRIKKYLNKEIHVEEQIIEVTNPKTGKTNLSEIVRERKEVKGDPSDA